MNKASERKLSNGIRVIAMPLSHLRSASVGAFIRIGSRYERVDNNGISHFLEHMMFRGAADYPTISALSGAFEALGGDLEAATHVDFMTFHSSFPAENLESGMELLATVLSSPRFEGIETERSVVREELLGDIDDNGQTVDLDTIFRRLVYGEHPLSLPLGGDVDTIATLTQASLAAHHRQFFVGAHIVIVVTGRIDEASVFASAERAFGTIPAGSEITSQPADSLPNGHFSFVRHAGSSQLSLRLGFPGLGLRSDDILILEVLLRLIDDGMSTRLYDRLVSQLGLVYEVFALSDPLEDVGTVEFGMQVAPEKVLPAFSALLSVIKELRLAPGEKDALQEAELQVAKNRFRWDLERMLDDSDGMMSYLGTHHAFGVDESMETTLKRLNAVTLDDVIRVSSLIFVPSRSALALVGLMNNEQEAALKSAFEIYRGRV